MKSRPFRERGHPGRHLVLARLLFFVPPSPRPSPTGAGEGEWYAVLLECRGVEWADTHSENKKRAMAVPSPGGEGQDEGEPLTKSDLRPGHPHHPIFH